MCTRWLLLVVTALALQGCLGVGSVWTGAMLVYDRHHVYKKVDDYNLGAKVNRALFADDILRAEGCGIDVAVFNRQVLLTGHLPSLKLRDEAEARVKDIPGIIKLYNQIAVARKPDNTIQDSWITAKVRSQMMQDAEINPKAFKIVTSDNIVYLMGNVEPHQAERVIMITQHTEGVRRVVNLMHYYQLTKPKTRHKKA